MSTASEDPEPASSSPPPGQSRKRHIEEEPEVLKSKKTKKRRKTKKSSAGNNLEDFDVEKGLNNAVGKLDSQLLADLVAQQTKRHSADLSVVELQDRHISARFFKDTSSWASTRTVDNLPSFLAEYSTGGDTSLKRAPKASGSPHTLVVTAAGLRAADVARALRVYQTKKSMVAKLFAKHIKLKDAIEQAEKTRIGIGVGTPTRLIDLLDAGTLKVDNLARIVVDGSYIDQKRRGIFDMKDTHMPLVDLLNRICQLSSLDPSLEILVF